MKIENFIAAYSADEDRILLKVCTPLEQYHFWLTRRALTVLCEAITRVLKSQYALLSAEACAPQHAAAFASFGHVEATQKHQMCNTICSFALEKDPILVYEIGYKALNQDNSLLRLATKHGQGFDFQFTRGVLHALLNLLNVQLKQANWGISISDVDHGYAIEQGILKNQTAFH